MVSSAAQRLLGTGLPSGTTPKVLDRLRAAIRARHYSLRTEEAYVGWIRRFILFRKRRQRTKGSSHNVARSGQGTAS